MERWVGFGEFRLDTPQRAVAIAALALRRLAAGSFILVMGTRGLYYQNSCQFSAESRTMSKVLTRILRFCARTDNYLKEKGYFKPLEIACAFIQRKAEDRGIAWRRQVHIKSGTSAHFSVHFLFQTKPMALSKRFVRQRSAVSIHTTLNIAL
jgi:hypothetical protein